MKHMRFYEKREQLRRWQEREKELEAKEEKTPPKRSKPKIEFRLGMDGEPWVWVMGEHDDDLTIEDLLEQEAQQKALELAEKEMEALRLAEEAALADQLREEEERIEREEREKEEELMRKAQETAESERQNEELRLEEERRKQEEEKNRQLQVVKMRSENERRKSQTKMEREKNRRSSLILSSFKDAKEMFEKQAEVNRKQIEDAWQEQEKKAKEIDNERRQIARKAREEHRRSLKSKKTESMVVGMFAKHIKKPNDSKEMVKPTIAAKPVQGSRPANKDAVRRWFQEQEEPRGAGMDPSIQQVAPWFHGLISRGEAENLLEGKPVGSFMVRVSEKVWGYAISYKGESRCKHFLVDASEGHYQFFGTNQLPHSSLDDLVQHHKDAPISMMGKEILQNPVGQASDPPDYSDLFLKNSVESSYL